MTMSEDATGARGNRSTDRCSVLLPRMTNLKIESMQEIPAFRLGRFTRISIQRRLLSRPNYGGMYAAQQLLISLGCGVNLVKTKIV